MAGKFYFSIFLLLTMAVSITGCQPRVAVNESPIETHTTDTLEPFTLNNCAGGQDSYTKTEDMVMNYEFSGGLKASYKNIVEASLSDKYQSTAKKGNSWTHSVPQGYKQVITLDINYSERGGTITISKLLGTIHGDYSVKIPESISVKNMVDIKCGEGAVAPPQPVPQEPKPIYPCTDYTTVPLKLFWNGRDNDTVATKDGEAQARSAGYELVRIEGYIFPDQQPGTVPLKLFWNGQDNDTVATEDGQAQARSAGYELVRIEGYIFPDKQPGTIPLKLFWNGQDNDTNATEDAANQARSAGYELYRIEGYICP